MKHSQLDKFILHFEEPKEALDIILASIQRVIDKTQEKKRLAKQKKLLTKKS